MKNLKTFETFTLGDLDEFQKSDLNDELSYIEDEYGLDDEFDDKKTLDIIKKTLEQFKEDIPFWNNIHIQFVKDLRDDTIGMYVHDSCLRTPIILLSKDALETMKNEEGDYEFGLKMTIIHELGHAIVNIDNEYEMIEDENILQFEDEEVYVEDFAFNYYMYGQIPDEIEELLDKFKKL